jgi:hypothetical protein
MGSMSGEGVRELPGRLLLPGILPRKTQEKNVCFGDLPLTYRQGEPGEMGYNQAGWFSKPRLILYYR